MTYKDKFVAEVKHNGKIMRMRDGFVTLPFGSEYSLLFKNLNTRRASVKVSIDGQDVLGGQSLVVNPNDTVELEGFLKGNTARNKFKFIKKTQEIVDHRGDMIDDGTIRIEFAYEKDPVKMKTIINEHHHHYHHEYPQHVRGIWWQDTHFTYCQSTNDIIESSNNQAFYSNCNVSPENLSETFDMDQLQTPIDDMGITVKGSEINQGFNYVSMGPTEQAEVIVIHLKGTGSNGAQVQKPVTVKTKLTCSTCGKQSSSLYKYCPSCGTYLE